jgi:hypothetical protein
MKKLAIVALACLALSACKEPTTDDPNISNSNASVAVNDPTACGLASGTVVDEQTLHAAETAYNVPAHAYVTLDEAKQLPASVKATVKPLLEKAYAYLKLARTAYAAGDVCGLNGYAKAAEDLSEKAKALLPK